MHCFIIIIVIKKNKVKFIATSLWVQSKTHHTLYNSFTCTFSQKLCNYYFTIKSLLTDYSIREYTSSILSWPLFKLQMSHDAGMSRLFGLITQHGWRTPTLGWLINQMCYVIALVMHWEKAMVKRHENQRYQPRIACDAGWLQKF